MDTLQKDNKADEWVYFMIRFISSVLSNKRDHLNLPQLFCNVSYKHQWDIHFGLFSVGNNVLRAPVYCHPLEQLV